MRKEDPIVVGFYKHEDEAMHKFGYASTQSPVFYSDFIADDDYPTSCRLWGLR